VTHFQTGNERDRVGRTNIDANHERDSESLSVDHDSAPDLWQRLADRGHFPWLHVDVIRGAMTQKETIATANAMALIMA